MTRPASSGWALALGVYLLAPALVLGLGIAVVGATDRCAAPATDAGGLAVDPVAGTGNALGGGLGLSTTQWSRASAVVAVGEAMRVPPQGIVIALAVAHQESGLKNYANDGRGGDLGADQTGVNASLRLPHDAVGTDHGSVGVFQQQWPWWGTLTDLMTPATAARKFYQALLKVPAWQTLPLTVAAQRVQRSAYPNAYADDANLARSILEQITGNTTTTTDLQPAAAQTDCPDPAGSDVANAVVWPVPAQLAGSDRRNWGGRGGHWSSWHTGTDFSVPCGTPVLAAHAGTVQIDRTQPWAGPQLLKITTGPGRLTTWYAHMATLLVTDGQQVTAGQQVGEVGQEGNATGCHLHFEVHTRGGPIYGADNTNPTTWLRTHVGSNLNDQAQAAGAFVVATFNALGHSHTAPGGDKASWPDSPTRTRRLVDLLQRQHPDVVGLQELQRPQADLLQRLAGDTWAMTGNRDNVVIYRRDIFDLVSSTTVAIPYFGGHTRQMPLLRLRHRPSGNVIALLNVHNPADVHGPAARWRDQAIARERQAVARERAAGHPVLLIGDLNARASAFCAATADDLMSSASGGSHHTSCRPPARMGIDWILGAGARFSNYLADRQTIGGVSDHPYVEAVVSTPGRQ